MKIRVKGITTAGLDIHKMAAPAELGLEDETVGIRTPVEVTAHIKVAGNTLLSTTAVKVVFSSVCVRCLKPVEQTRHKDFIFDYPFDQQTELIDLSENIRQEIILDIPARILCKEDCQGICAGCGVDLNEEACLCKKTTGIQDARTQRHK